MLSNLGLLYGKAGRERSAIEMYERAVRIDPENAYAYNNLAQLYLEMAEYERALEFAIISAKKNSKMHQAYSAQAICYAMLGDYENFQRALSKYSALGKDKGAILRYIDKLRANV